MTVHTWNCIRDRSGNEAAEREGKPPIEPQGWRNRIRNRATFVERASFHDTDNELEDALVSLAAAAANWHSDLTRGQKDDWEPDSSDPRSQA